MHSTKIENSKEKKENYWKINLTGITVGSRALWIEPGSLPESTARRASSSTGAGGHHINSLQTCSFSITPLPQSPIELSNRREGSTEEDREWGEKGTRNLKQDLIFWASSALTDNACWGDPRRESKSLVVALGTALAEYFCALGLGKKSDGQVVLAVAAATEREKTTANLSESNGGLPKPMAMADCGWASCAILEILEILGNSWNFKILFNFL